MMEQSRKSGSGPRLCAELTAANLTAGRS
ncbi:MAG: hypothetical protein K0Q80_2191, partial [Microvirga sp.]|nr:hypothetical protein [Microvirga sp.]